MIMFLDFIAGFWKRKKNYPSVNIAVSTDFSKRKFDAASFHQTINPTLHEEVISRIGSLSTSDEGIKQRVSAKWNPLPYANV